jgi:glycosyltransferase involved in cell wall biosynthesis
MPISPLISVIMPVYNAEPYLWEAIESILAQTMGDFEFIILNDGSKDASHEIITTYQKRDARIIYHKFEQNRGLPDVLNTGLSLARGKYIARMDADDISLPGRFQRQITFMESHSNVGISGTWVQVIGDGAGVVVRFPLHYDAIYARMLFQNSVAHPSVMMRTEALRSNDLWYDAAAPHAEDYDLWCRAIPYVHFENLPEVLLNYRQHSSSTAKKHALTQQETCKNIYYRMMTRFGIQPSPEDLLLHGRLGTNQPPSSLDAIAHAYRWLEKISANNRRLKIVNSSALDAELGFRGAMQWQQYPGRIPISCLSSIMSSPLPFKNNTGIMKLLRALIFFVQKSLV